MASRSLSTPESIRHADHHVGFACHACLPAGTQGVRAQPPRRHKDIINAIFHHADADHSRGDIIVLLDADLQNDPLDIPRLLAKLDEGYDVVSGWRKYRQDAAFRRRFISRLANALISRTSGVRLRDYGCTLKAYRREVVSGSHRLYGEMHRFIPIYASWSGARITEMEVTHHPRTHGTSKYGLARIGKVILDVVLVIFIQKYLEKPIYVFGGFAILSLLVGFLAFFAMIYLKFANGLSMIQTPLPLVASMFVLVGIVSLLLGLLAEIMVRVYYEARGRQTYAIKSHINAP
jgi:glycosyltransferase involved in cell wall biosynthesis